MPVPGQPLRVLYWMDDWPNPEPFGFGELWPEDASFVVDADATVQIQTKYPLDTIPLVKISVVDPCIPGSIWFTERAIDTGSHGYAFVLQECIYYAPSVPVLHLHPIFTKWSCAGAPP